MKKLILCIVISTLLISCRDNSEKNVLTEGYSNLLSDYESSEIDPIEQARPTIMVLPGDQSLNEYDCIQNITIDNTEFLVRDYQEYLHKDEVYKLVASKIQDEFVGLNYPLDDFEQTLKSLDTKHSSNIADGVSQDSKTALLQAAHPDIIVELSHSAKSNIRSHDYKHLNFNYVLQAIDAYTNKVVSSISSNDLIGEEEAQMIQDDISKKMSKFTNDVHKYFSDIMRRGREVTVCINLDENSNQFLDSECIEGDTYTDELIDYVKAHTIKGAYKMQINTAHELKFTNCRIKMINDDGTQYGVYDWTKDLQKYLKKNLGLSSINRSQGLGLIELTITGI